MNKRKSQYGSFDIKRKIESDVVALYRLFFILAAFLSPVFSFIIFDHNTLVQNVYIDMSIALLLFSVWAGSFYSDKIKFNLKNILFGFSIIISFYAYLIYAGSGYSFYHFIGFIIAYLAFLVGISDYRFSVIYSSLIVLLVIVVQNFVFNNANPNQLVEISAYILLGVIGFYIHYSNFKILHIVLFNEGLLNNILNSTDNAMILLDGNKKIIDMNAKAVQLFRSKDKNILVGKDIYEAGNISSDFFVNGRVDFKTNDGITVRAETKFNTIEYRGLKYFILSVRDITETVKQSTELKLVKEQLLESEKTYRELFDNSIDLLLIVDKKLEIIDINRKVIRESGIAEDDIIGKNFSEFINEEDIDRFNKFYSESDTAEFITLELFNKKFDINFRKASYFEIEHIVISARSAESRIKYQDELRESRDQMTMILENINSIIFYQKIDDNGQYHLRYISPKIEEIIGINVIDFIQLTKTGKADELYHPDDIKKVNEQRENVIKYKKAVSFIYRVKKEDDYIWLEERVYPKFNEKGEHIANFGVATDVTQSIKDKQALDLSHKRNKEFIERNLAGFYRLNLNRDILDCNDAFARIFGYRFAHELIGKNVNEIYLDSTDRHSFIYNLQKYKNILNNESKITLTDHRVIWILENASLVFDADKNEVIESTVFDITDLKRAEIALEKSEETLSLILNSIEDLIYNIDILENGNKHFNYLGKQVESITGLTKEEYIRISNDKSIINFIHPDDRPEVINKNERLRIDKKHQDYLYRFKTKEKGYVWLEENVFPQVDKRGRLSRIFGVVREVTEKKKHEQELINSKERYRILFEKNMAGVFRTKTTGEFLDCNEAFVKIFGYSSKEELLSIKSNNLYFTDDDREKYIQRLRKEKVLLNYELLHKKKDGSRLWVLVNVSLLEDTETKEEFIQGTLIDISELKQASEVIMENEEKFRLLFEATNDAIFILENNKIVDCNDKSLEIFGCEIHKKEEELKKSSELYELSPRIQPDGMPSFEKLGKKIKEVLKGNSQMFYWRFQRFDGQLFDAEVSMNKFHLNGRDYIQTIIRDITARMKAEVALRESEDRFKMISNATIEGIIFTENGEIVDANEQFASLYGYNSRNQIIGKHINEFLYSESDVEKVKSVIQSNSEEKFEVKSRKQDGSVIWVESKGRIIPYHGKKLRVSMVYDITERKIKEQELQDSRESFMNLTELSPNGSIIHFDGIIQYANPAVLNFLGYKNKEDLLGKNIIEFLPEDEKARSKERIEKIKNGEAVGYTEFVVKGKNNEPVEIGVQSVKIIYNGQEAIHVIIIDLSKQRELQKEKLRAQLAEETNKLLEKEIQERKEAEHRLWETQMFTTNMFNSSMDMIMASDRNNLITQVNISALKIFGYKTEEIIGLHPRYLYDSEEEFERVSSALLSKGSFSGEIKNKKKTGETFISFLSASVLRNTQGKIIGTMGISRDITEALSAQKKIQEQNAQIRSIFDSASNMLIWSINRNYELVSFNNNFSEIVKYNFGKTPKKGMSIIELLKPYLKDDLLQYSIDSFNRTLAGHNSELEGPFVTKRGNTIWIETFLNPIFMEDKTINEISCISHEITEKKAAESQIRLSLKEKEVLLKEVHHRVKNNLQVISSILNLQSSYVKDDQTLSILRESQNRIKSMSYIHESLYQTKNFSSINFSEYIINLSNNLFHSYQIFDNFIELKQNVGKVSLNLDQAIPCGLIVNEIITNSLKYAFKGRKKGEIFIGIEEKKNKIIIRIEDDGIGLPDGFDYRKTDTLGLQLVATLVEQLDGEMKLKSARGTKYLITFEKYT